MNLNINYPPMEVQSLSTVKEGNYYEFLSMA